MDPKQFRYLLWLPVIGGIAAIAAMSVLGQSIEATRASDVISVTGSVKQRVWSDFAKWDASFSKNADATNVPQTVAAVNADLKKITSFIKEHGIDEASIRITPPQTDPVYEQLPNYVQSQKIIGYVIRQNITVESLMVDKIEALAKDAIKLAGDNIIFSNQNTSYSYTKLADLRPELFAKATADAKIRAEAIAKGTGVKVGKPRSARTGVIQVLQPNSNDISDYGNYDTSTKEKEINAVVTVSFDLQQ